MPILRSTEDAISAVFLYYVQRGGYATLPISPYEAQANGVWIGETPDVDRWNYLTSISTDRQVDHGYRAQSLHDCGNGLYLVNWKDATDHTKIVAHVGSTGGRTKQGFFEILVAP